MRNIIAMQSIWFLMKFVDETEIGAFKKKTSLTQALFAFSRFPIEFMITIFIVRSVRFSSANYMSVVTLYIDCNWVSDINNREREKKDNKDPFLQTGIRVPQTTIDYLFAFSSCCFVVMWVPLHVHEKYVPFVFNVGVIKATENETKAEY